VPARRAGDHRAFVKTTGSKGLHIYARLEPRWDATRCGPRRWRWPASSSDDGRPHHRGVVEGGARHRVFVDFNQNAPHKTVFGAWSCGHGWVAQVSTPIRWDEVDTVDPTS
jgi:DNA primase